jgi:hypothetical protein
MVRGMAVRLSEVKSALAASRPRCIVYANSYCEHVMQLYAGLYVLRLDGAIDLDQKFGRGALNHRLGEPLAAGFASKSLPALLLDVEGAGLVLFDLRDGGNFYEEALDQVSLYVKRSYRRGLYGRHAYKFIPMGLNYLLYLDRTTALELVRALRQFDASIKSAKMLAAALARIVPGAGALHTVPTLKSLAPAPEPRTLRAIFLCATWQPDADHAPEEVKPLNDFRAACIRTLRRRFGEQFLGGFARTAHAAALYPDWLAPAGVRTQRSDYLKLLRQFAVCVATTGYFDSIGWKFAEYTALGKAIVCEPLRFELPGPIAPGANYLEFSTPQQCADRVAELFGAAAMRHEMGERNHRYFEEFARPEAVVGRAIYAALLRSRTSGAGAAQPASVEMES